MCCITHLWQIGIFLSEILLACRDVGDVDIVGVCDVPQEEGASGHGSACGAAVAAVEYCDDVFGLHLASSDVDEGAYDGPYHIAEETVGGDFEVPCAFVVNPVPSGFAEVAYIGFDVGV